MRDGAGRYVFMVNPVAGLYVRRQLGLFPMGGALGNRTTYAMCVLQAAPWPDYCVCVAGRLAFRISAYPD